MFTTHDQPLNLTRTGGVQHTDNIMGTNLSQIHNIISERIFFKTKLAQNFWRPPTSFRDTKLRLSFEFYFILMSIAKIVITDLYIFTQVFTFI